MNKTFSEIKDAVKDYCLGVRAPALRCALDAVLRWRAERQILLTDYRRIHQAIEPRLRCEMDTILGFATEFETEMYVRRFETDFAAICSCRQAVGTHSGTAALQLAMTALGIGPGDEVITVPYTYVATALAISNTGATPVFVDVEDDTFNMDPQRVERAITPRTKAILPVHLFGQMADIPRILSIANAHGLKVIEDACQAYGAELHGRKPGSDTHAACYSFSSPKNLSGFGNGGMIVTNDRALASQVRVLRNPEANTGALRASRRTPCYLDAVQVAFLRAKLAVADCWRGQRSCHAARYREVLAGCDLKLPTEAPGALHSYYRFAVRTARRDDLLRALHAGGIRAALGYRNCLHLSRTCSDLGHVAGDFPRAEAAARQTVLLPISAQLADEECEHVAHTVLDFCNRQRTR